LNHQIEEAGVGRACGAIEEEEGRVEVISRKTRGKETIRNTKTQVGG
jgi:hypothetical protein